MTIRELRTELTKPNRAVMCHVCGRIVAKFRFQEEKIYACDDCIQEASKPEVSTDEREAIGRVLKNEIFYELQRMRTEGDDSATRLARVVMMKIDEISLPTQ